MSKYFFTEILKAGHEIRIQSDSKHTEPCTATVFRYKDGEFYFDNAEMIRPNILHWSMTPERFESHVNRLIKEGFKIEIFTP